MSPARSRMAYTFQYSKAILSGSIVLSPKSSGYISLFGARTHQILCPQCSSTTVPNPPASMCIPLYAPGAAAMEKLTCRPGNACIPLATEPDVRSHSVRRFTVVLQMYISIGYKKQINPLHAPANDFRPLAFLFGRSGQPIDSRLRAAPRTLQELLWFEVEDHVLRFELVAVVRV